MYKSLLAILFVTSASDASRSQLQKDLDRSDAVEDLATLMFASLPSSSSSKGPARSSVVEMGGGQLAIRKRIVATKKAAKITNSMKMVAASRANKAALAAQNSNPFVEELRRTASKLNDRLALEDTGDIPLLEMRPVKKVALVVISGDRGLCGAYNSKIIKKAEARIKELNDLGIGTEIFSVGEKGTKYFAQRKYEMIAEYKCGGNPTSKESQAIIKEVISRFLEGEVDRVELLYTSFTSMLSSTASIRTIIPFSVSKDGIEMEDDEIKFTSKDGKLAVESSKSGSEKLSLPVDAVLEQSPESLINTIMPMYLNGGLLCAWQNCIAAELGSRFAAMQAATDNAKNLGEELSTLLNRMRQSAVTQEISEIVSGTMAVE